VSLLSKIGKRVLEIKKRSGWIGYSEKCLSVAVSYKQ